MFTQLGLVLQEWELGLIEWHLRLAVVALILLTSNPIYIVLFLHSRPRCLIDTLAQFIGLCTALSDIVILFCTTCIGQFNPVSPHRLEFATSSCGRNFILRFGHI